MLDPTYPLFPVASFIACAITLIPLPWHLQAWNSGTCAFMMWTAATSFVRAVNSVIWKDNVENVAPVWCDITTQIMLGAGVGIPASILCISRRLYKITTIQAVAVTREDKRKDLYIDLSISVGIPIIALICHIVVHPHRFDIFEQIGCFPVTYYTLPTWFLWYLWPVGLGVVSFVYSALTLRSFIIRRAQFASLLSTTNVSLQRYFRLMLLSIADMLLTLPLSIWTVVTNSSVVMAPWVSWEETHYGWSRIGYRPALVWRQNATAQTAVEITRWLPVLCAIIFFGLFGFASEAQKNYKRIFNAFSRFVGYKPKPASKKPKFHMTMPTLKKVTTTRQNSDATLPVYSVGPQLSGKSLKDSFELGPYSPTSDKTAVSSPKSYTPSMYLSSPTRHQHSVASFEACASSSVGHLTLMEDDVSLVTHDRVDENVMPRGEDSFIVGGDYVASMSELRRHGFEDDFKPLPPLPSQADSTTTEPARASQAPTRTPLSLPTSPSRTYPSPFTWEPVRSPTRAEVHVPRRPTSVPSALDRQTHEIPLPLYAV
ncbi:STE3-domain-containing protein [Cylindrobasidium torrendii FP15055 ss-10]|uniref:STE3-domain-containing protein n=1 Tax=Cylindrobasidium torrendii FP15055 ss-10 TaxID=1314674 RepID=A0A0D7B7J0_9AGAR|nr:STE3-domain-containing protein [Cylindrobasidium torrendii FP15055 ss-10]